MGEPRRRARRAREGESQERHRTASRPTPLADIAAEGEERRTTAIGELDRVLGGGMVAGSAILIGGDPGIGKSTLLLQATASLAASGAKVLYVSGEESAQQIRMRGERLGVGASEGVDLLRDLARADPRDRGGARAGRHRRRLHPDRDER